MEDIWSIGMMFEFENNDNTNSYLELLFNLITHSFSAQIDLFPRMSCKPSSFYWIYPRECTCGAIWVFELIVEIVNRVRWGV